MPCGVAGRIGVMAGMRMTLDASAKHLRNGYSISDMRNLQRALKNLDPNLRKALLREAKAPAKPVQSAIKSAIPAVAPMSGMTRGRLSWSNSVDSKGRAHNPKDVKIQFRTSSSGKSKVTSLVRVAVKSPAVVFADMAGKTERYMGAGYKGSGVTRPYPYKGGTRVHRVDGNGVKKPNRRYKYSRQGDALLAALGGKASRYVWPAAERAVPQVTQQIDVVINKFISIVNQKGL